MTLKINIKTQKPNLNMMYDPDNKTQFYDPKSKLSNFSSYGGVSMNVNSDNT